MATTMCHRNRLSLYINHRVFKTITVRVYYIIHFCDSIWSLWVEANLVVYIYYAFGDPIIKNEWILVFNATFSNISAISWRPVLLVEEAGVPWENHRPWARNDKLHPLQLQVECTFIVIYKDGRKPTLTFSYHFLFIYTQYVIHTLESNVLFIKRALQVPE
jgi:hypothetical protein